MFKFDRCWLFNSTISDCQIRNEFCALPNVYHLDVHLWETGGWNGD